MCHVQHPFIPLYNDNELLTLWYFLSAKHLLSISFYRYERVLHFHMITAVLLIISFFLFKINCLPLRNYKTFSYNLCIQSLYTLCIFSMLLNEDIVGIGKPYGIPSLTFVGDEFSALFLHPSIFSITHSGSL